MNTTTENMYNFEKNGNEIFSTAELMTGIGGYSQIPYLPANFSAKYILPFK